jgi:hypothetical protein
MREPQEKKAVIYTPDGKVAVRPTTVGPDGVDDVVETLRQLNSADKEIAPVISQRVHVQPEKIERAISFWKPRYFDYIVEGRHLNGVEAYVLGDPSKTEHPNPVPYIAMCNLMALEALRMMGNQLPTVENPELMMLGSEREREISDFWKKCFAPTLFQVQWAWSAAMAVMAGEPGATAEILENYAHQIS